MKGHWSIAVKNGIVYLVVLLTACMTLGFLLFQSSSKVIKQYVQTQMAHSLDLLEAEFQNYLSSIENDVLFISEHPVLQGSESTWDKYALDQLKEEFIRLLAKKPEYAQIRLIGTANEGKELIRAERGSNGAFLVADDLLQSKGDRDYYAEGMMRSKEEVYFSTINLNREFGKISLPKTPTLRAAVPLIIDEAFNGIVIINLDLTDFFQRLQNYAGPEQTFILINNELDFLVHPETPKTFGFEFEKDSLAHPFILASTVNGEGPFEYSLTPERPYDFLIQRWDYPRENYYLNCALGLSPEVLMTPIHDWRKTSLFYLFIIVLVFTLLLLWFMRRQMNELKQITASMSVSNLNKDLTGLPIHRNDEIGDLARTFQKLMTKIDQSFDEVEKEKHTALMAMKDKEAFIENMSHELRNPLQSIMGMRKILEQNKPRKDQEPILASMRFATDQLHALVNDVLDYAQLKLGTIKLKPEPHQIGQLLKDIVSSHQYDANMNGVDLTLEMDQKISSQSFMIDKIRLVQVLNNLISNGIKFTSKGGQVKVELSASKIEKGLLFSIKDNGRGMSMEEVQRVQNRFERGISDSDSVIQGAGLGLPVVLQLLELFGSQLNIESTMDKGTQCSFVMHWDSVDPIAQVEPDQASVPSYFYPERVLIIEDDRQLLMLYKHFFTKWPDVKMEECTNLEEWNKKLHERNTYDLIISDLRLGETSIIEHVKDMGTLNSPQGLCIIVTGQLPDESKSISQFPVLTKPIQMKDVEELWKKHLEKEISRPPSLEGLYMDYDRDPEMVAKALNLLKKEWGKMTAELIDAVSQGDQRKCSSVYHKLTTTLKRLELFALDKQLDHWIHLNEGKIKPSDLSQMKSWFNNISVALDQEH